MNRTAPYYDIAMRDKPRPKTTEMYLKEVIGELGRLTNALIAAVERVPEVQPINIDVPPAQIFEAEKENDNQPLIDEVKRLGEAITALANRKQETPIINVEHKSPDIVFPEMKMPAINIPEMRLPEIRMPEIRMPDINIPEIKIPAINYTPPAARSWKFKHKYDVYNKLVETTATPE